MYFSLIVYHIGSRAWETMTFRGHLNNVSCVLFHAKENVIISNSEDKSLRIWDISRKYPALNFRRDSDRYWILASHPRLNLLAAGHDNGMIVFKLSRERPSYYTYMNKSIYFYNNGFIRNYDINHKSIKPVIQTKQMSKTGYSFSAALSKRRLKRPRRLFYNPYASSKEINILMFYSTSSSSGSGGNTNTAGNTMANAISSSVSSVSPFNSGGGNGTGHLYTDPDSSYELYVMDKHGNNGKNCGSRSNAKSVAFVNRNRFAVLEHSSFVINANAHGFTGQQILLKNMENVSKKKIKLPIDRSSGSTVNYIFEGGNGRLILRSAEWITLFDVMSRKVIKKMQIPTRFAIKFVCWDSEYEQCALLAKFSVIICDSNLNDICTIYENAKVKSGAWNASSDVFIYTTVTHMKYALPTGDHGIIKTLDEVYYICNINEDIVTCMTREWSMKTFDINSTEFVFKKALIKKNFSLVKKIINSGKLKGESIIAYLQKKGFSEVALRFVEDDSTRFDLALECGHIDVAFECARNIDSKLIWNRFGIAALMMGNYRCVTEAYKQTLNFEKLMYLFLITGNFPTLGKLMDIAMAKDNRMMVFNIALFTNDVEKKIQCLKDSGQYGFAYLTAMSNDMIDIAQDIKSEYLSDKDIHIPQWFNDEQQWKIKRPVPVFGPFLPSEDYKYDWPRKEVPIAYFDREIDDDDADGHMNNINTHGKQHIISDDESNDDGHVNEFEMDFDEDEDDEVFDDWDASIGKKKHKSQTSSSSKSSPLKHSKIGLIADDDDLILSEDDDDDGHHNDDEQSLNDNLFVVPVFGPSTRKKWLERSVSAPDMIAAGAFDLAMECLHRQFGIVNFAPLKTYFLRIYTSCHAYVRALPNSESFAVGLRRNTNHSNEYMADISITLKDCHEFIKKAYMTVDDNCSDAILLFRKVLHMIPLLIVCTSDELKSVRNLIDTAREYINALRVKEASEMEVQNSCRQFELLCYFTHFDLQDSHLFSGLYMAMKVGYKSGNYKTTAVLCRRLLELAQTGRVRNESSLKYANQVKKVLKKCEAKNVDANEDEMEYKPHDFQYLCCQSLRPILRNEQSVKSPFCGSVFKEEYNGMLSPVCELVRIGTSAQGVTINI